VENSAEIMVDFLGARFSRENQRKVCREEVESLFRLNRVLECRTKRRRFFV